MKSLLLKNFLSAFFMLIAASSFAQEGHITVVEDSSIQQVLSMYQTFAKEKRQINGYRIQLAANSSRQALIDMKAKFIQQYPDVGAYLEYSAPQFKLRVGDFRDRSEAEAFVTEVRKFFSYAFIVPDKILVEGVEW